MGAREVHNQLRAGKFELIDGEGRIQFTIALIKWNEAPVLVILDNNHRERLRLVAYPVGEEGSSDPETSLIVNDGTPTDGVVWDSRQPTIGGDSLFLDRIGFVDRDSSAWLRLEPIPPLADGGTSRPPNPAKG